MFEMLDVIDPLILKARKVRDEAGAPKGEAGELVDRQTHDEFKRAVLHMEEARKWLLIHENRINPAE
jgi:hypothetical protein